ncbi:sugar transferase [Ancylomarina salipaludis]|uniref:Sugar transferase n=1 Tax=Ancylomarina salipaludis TaxID=2501299 RepID=A0A4Q1JPW0_9BACT|nr:sugar transferase [Ancylomarina salipaludis]
MYLRYFKPVFDFTIAFVLLIALSPIFLIIYFLLLLTGIHKPFFLQERSGYKGQSFLIIKFRTMTDKRDRSGKLLPDKDRLTFIGKIIRKLSFDEIPQLINILKGDMSLIGPRPLLPRYLPYYTKKESLRHTVKPGMSGLAQINGGNTLDWDTRLALDIEYITDITFKNDCIILLKTIKMVLFSDGSCVDPRSVIKDLNDERGGDIN